MSIIKEVFPNFRSLKSEKDWIQELKNQIKEKRNNNSQKEGKNIELFVPATDKVVYDEGTLVKEAYSKGQYFGGANNTNEHNSKIQYNGQYGKELYKNNNMFTNMGYNEMGTENTYDIPRINKLLEQLRNLIISLKSSNNNNIYHITIIILLLVILLRQK